ncbi:MAG: hypothetical protein KGD63_12735 [Candidatus Lokiarchaeota archaeon]|nr:hypothetical protein [Candidatus Lokiarchaeota archaeon]
MYCPKCKTEVSIKREEINWVLVVILAIFTAGIGVLIYLAIYFDKPENRCIHCDSICQKTVVLHSPYVLNPITPNVVSNSNKQIYSKTPSDNIENTSTIINKYCPFCGSKLGDGEGGKFCPFCGYNIE